MVRIPKHIQELTPYEPGKKGEKLFNGPQPKETAILCSNENNLGPSPKAVNAMAIALRNVHVYPDPLGTRLRVAIANKLGLSKEHVALGDGSDGILYSLFNAFCEAQDHIITSKGSFISVKVFSSLYQIPLIEVPLTKQYEFDLNSILKRINDHTQIIYLCNPNNPTGTIIREKELSNFLAQVPRHILVIVDEAYYEFASMITPEYPDSTKMGYENVLTLRTFSKAYGLAGIRLGYAMGHPTLIQTIIKTQPIFSPGSVSMAAGIGALADDEFLLFTIKHHLKGLNQHYQTLQEAGISYTPSYGNFVMADLESSEHALWLCDQLESRGIKIRRLHAFGLPSCVRISVGTDRENEYFRDQLLDLFSSRITPSARNVHPPSH